MKEQLGQYGQYFGIGLEFAASILVFIFLGRYLDGRWGTEPWLTLCGAVFGFGAGFYHLYKTLTSLSGGKRSGNGGGE